MAQLGDSIINGNLRVNGNVIFDSFVISGLTQNSSFHNNIYRGKDITADWNSGKVSTNIANGTFDDIYIGDYFTKSATINSTAYTLTYIVADLDTYYGGYNSNAVVNTHHIGVVVKGLPDARMYSTNVTYVTNNTADKGGYFAGEMYTTTLPAYATGISNSLGSTHLLSHNILVSNQVNTTVASASMSSRKGASVNWNWYTNNITLLTECQVYGHTVWSSSGYDTGEAYRQLSIFRMRNVNNVFGKNWFWLRDVASSTNFCNCSGDGNAGAIGASATSSVFPLLLLK